MQVTAQQQEMAVLDRQLGHKKEELHLLQESMVQAKADLQEALRVGETEVTEKCNYIRVCFPVDFLKSPRIVLGYRFIFIGSLPNANTNFQILTLLYHQFGGVLYSSAVTVMCSSPMFSGYAQGVLLLYFPHTCSFPGMLFLSMSRSYLFLLVQVHATKTSLTSPLP